MVTYLSLIHIYAICVYALNSNSDFTAVSNTYTETYATTLPKKIRDFKVTTAYPGDASFEWKGINGAKAFQLQITKVSDSKKFKKPIVNETKFYSYLGTYTNSKKIKAGTFYSARVRSYVTLAGTKQKVYSPWSTCLLYTSVCHPLLHNCCFLLYLSDHCQPDYLR